MKAILPCRRLLIDIGSFRGQQRTATEKKGTASDREYFGCGRLYATANSRAYRRSYALRRKRSRIVCASTQPLRDVAEVLIEVAGIIRLVEVLREHLEQTIIIRLVSALRRVKDDQPTSGLQHACELAEHSPAHLGRQFMKHEHVRDRILAAPVRKRDHLTVSDHELQPGPGYQEVPAASRRYGSDMSRPMHGNRGQHCLTRVEKPPGAAS